MIFTVIKNPGTLGYILVIEVLKTKDLPDTRNYRPLGRNCRRTLLT
jgi:hypothetical protein